MRIVLGVLQADSGAVRWQGRDVDAETRRRFGYMPEERGLYPKMQVRDQLVYLARLHGLEPGDARSHADRRTERLGVAERAGDRAESLSLGNQQRVQLAAALVHDPEVLVLDEPFSGLDPVGVDVMTACCASRPTPARRWCSPATSSSSSSGSASPSRSSTDGRIVASGRVEDLRARDARRRVRVEVGGDGRLARRRRRRPVLEPRREGAIVGLDDAEPERARRGARRWPGPALQRRPAQPDRSVPAGGRAMTSRRLSDRRAARAHRAREGPGLPDLDRDRGAGAVGGIVTRRCSTAPRASPRRRRTATRSVAGPPAVDEFDRSDGAQLAAGEARQAVDDGDVEPSSTPVGSRSETPDQLVGLIQAVRSGSVRAGR